MTTEDFLNPVLYVDKYIAFLKDKTFDFCLLFIDEVVYIIHQDYNLNIRVYEYE